MARRVLKSPQKRSTKNADKLISGMVKLGVGLGKAAISSGNKSSRRQRRRVYRSPKNVGCVVFIAIVFIPIVGLMFLL